MSVLSKLNDCVATKGAGFIVLIDPDKKNDKNIDHCVESANQNGADALFVGAGIPSFPTITFPSKSILK